MKKIILIFTVFLSLIVIIPKVFSAVSILATLPINTSYSIAVNEKTNKIYAINDGMIVVSVIDGLGDSLLNTFSVSGRLLFDIGLNPTTNKIYIASSSSNPGAPIDTLLVVDGMSEKVSTEIMLEKGTDEITVDPDLNVIYVRSNKSLYVINGESNKVLDMIQVGTDFITDFTINSKTNKLYVCDNEFSPPGKLNIVDFSEATNMLSVINSISIGTGAPLHIAINSKTDRAYVSTNMDKSVFVLDTNTNQLISTIPIASSDFIFDLAINPSTNKLYVAYSTATSGINNITVYDGTTGEAKETFQLDGRNFGVNSKTNKVYFSSSKSGQANITILGDDAPASSSSGSTSSSTSGGLSTTSSSGGTSSTPEVDQIISIANDIGDTAKKLKKERKKAAVKTAKKLLAAKLKIESALEDIPHAKCKALFTRALGEINDALALVGANRCGTEITPNCISGNVAEETLQRIGSAATNLDRFISTDKDGDGIPDICQVFDF